MNEHIGDDAALYALGALDDVSRRRIEAHVATCAACAQQLGEAEADVTTMVLAQPQFAAPAGFVPRAVPATRPAWRSRAVAQLAAIAAILVLALIPAGFLYRQNEAMHETMVAQSAAMQQLASGGFRTASFAGMSGGAQAHVMYAPDGSWYVVMVRGASKALDVIWMHDGERTMLGTAERHGDVAMLYLPRSHRMDQLALVDGPTVVAEAQLAY